MIPRVLKALSRYVDTRLMDYSAILGLSRLIECIKVLLGPGL